MNINSAVETGRTRREGAVRALPAHLIHRPLPTAFPYCVSGAVATTPGQPHSLLISFSPHSPAPQHTHSASEQRWAMAVSLGDRLGPNPGGEGARGEGEPGEARSPWRRARESQGDA